MPATLTTPPTKTELRTTTPRRWTRFDELLAEVERFWDKGFPFRLDPFVTNAKEMRNLPFDWAPRIEMFEKSGNLILRAELPGMKKEEIEIVMDGEDLVLRGERHHVVETEEKEMYRSELAYGAFFRRIPLGFELKPEMIKATLVNGVLELHVPIPVEKTKEVHKIKIT